MITISLDEQGVFEKNNGKNDGIVMIAGIVYDDRGDSKDSEREKTRIREYFTRVCRTCRAPYPDSLHVNDFLKNDRYVAQTKTEYSKTLASFLKKGEYKGAKVPSSDGKDRIGEYYVFALIKSPKGKPELSSKRVSNLIKEDYASNLYMHMVEDMISRLLFYNNRFLDHESVCLDLATRVYMGRNEEDISAHTSLGYNERHVSRGEMVFLTNSDVFRTALAREMLYETENDILINSLEARSIKYDEPDGGFEFLYLSDAICTILGAGNTYSLPSYINESWNRLEHLCGDNRFLFLYDAVDTGFTKAWKQTDSGNLYKALSVFYDCTTKNTKEARFYKKQWNDTFNKHIIRRIDTSSFAMAVRQFAQSTRNNNLKPAKLVYIYESLLALKDSISFSNPQDKAVLYDLYDAGASTYNHVGKSDKAQECITLCKQYAKYIGVERELRNRNKYVVSLCDSLQYDKAIDMAEDTYQCYKKIFEVQKSIYGDNNANVHDFAIINSQLGQCHAFAGNDQAEEYLLAALKLYDKGTPDYFQTESYLLHYYVQTGNNEKYRIYAKEFFGGHDEPKEQLEYIVTEGLKKTDPLISFNFAIFIFVKGIYAFYLKELSQEMKDKIFSLEETLIHMDKRALDHINGYPWLLIYKHLSLICIANKNDKSAVYMKKILTTKVGDGILNLIKQCAVNSIADASNDYGLAEEYRTRAIESYNQVLNSEDNPEKDFSKVLDTIGFLYC